MTSTTQTPPALSLAGHRIETRVFAPAGVDRTAATGQTVATNRRAATDRPADAPPRLVLLHEGLGCIDLWRGFPQALADRLGEPVLAYSRYGYGRSDVLEQARDKWFMHDEAAQALPQLLDAFGIGRALLVGHSDGASIALLHAAGNPERTQAVVTMAPHLFVEPVCISSIAQAHASYEASGMQQRLARYHRDPRRTFLGWSEIWLSDTFADWNIEPQVAQIRCPVLAIQGEQDQYGTMRQIEQIARLTPATQLLKLGQCRHSPHLDQPEAVLAGIERFVAAL